MKKGISIWSFAEPNLKKCFELAKDAGFDGVEVALADEGDITTQSTKEEIMQVKAWADEVGIELYSVASGLYWETNYTNNDAAKRAKAKEITKKHLEIASWLGCDTILVVPGGAGVDFIPNSDVVEYDVAHDRVLEALLELAPIAEKFGVSIGVENVWNKLFLSPLEMRDLIDKVNSKFVGAYFDVGNVVYSGYPEHWIKILGNRIRKVHFKDYRLAAGGLHGFVDLLYGDVNWPAVMQMFDKIGYNGWVTAEMLPPYTHYPEQIIYNTSKSMDKIIGGRR